ncbi:MAG: hypothetical protein AB4372_30825 [Xenococcus sp. (in: cyanobacteria)]
MQLPEKIRGRIERIRRGGYYPKNIIRICRKRTEFIKIINEAINNSGSSWESELLQRVIKFVFADQDSDISVYDTNTLDPLDPSHAIALIAEGIAQDPFKVSKGNRRKSGCTRGSLIIPIDCLPQSTQYQFTPKGNLDFYPANYRHFDLKIGNKSELATAILDGICKQKIVYTLLANDNKTYQIQASIAYSYCLSIFGELSASNPPSQWQDGKNLTASEQIETLQHLAQINIFSKLNNK